MLHVFDWTFFSSIFCRNPTCNKKRKGIVPLPRFFLSQSMKLQTTLKISFPLFMLHYISGSIFILFMETYNWNIFVEPEWNYLSTRRSSHKLQLKIFPLYIHFLDMAWVCPFHWIKLVPKNQLPYAKSLVYFNDVEKRGWPLLSLIATTIHE